MQRWPSLRTITLALALVGPGVAVACGSDGLLQGDEYQPDGRIPIAPASDRVDAGGCDGASCDGGADVDPLPIGDASTAPSNTCETARDMGSVAGDQDLDSVSADGTCSEWLSVRVTEDNSSALGAPMKVRLTLTPTGGDFDLYAYFNADRDTRSCSFPSAQSVAPGTVPETVSLTWGEGTVANGNDDGRTVTVAVIKAGGPCGPDGGSYRLTAEGNR